MIKKGKDDYLFRNHVIVVEISSGTVGKCIESGLMRLFYMHCVKGKVEINNAKKKFRFSF